MEYRETYDICHLDGPNAIFPDEHVAALRPTMTKLAQLTRELTFRFMKSLAMSIGLVSVIAFKITYLLHL